MSKEEKTKNNNTEIEIDLFALFWRLLDQWKAILLCVLAMGLFFSLFGYARSVRHYRAVVAGHDQKEVSEDEQTQKEYYSAEYGERTAEVLLELDKTDRAAVENILRLEKTTQKEKNYFKDSIYLNLDPNNERRIVLGYLVTCGDEKDKALLETLIREYLTYLYSDSVVENVQKVIDPNVDTRFIRQLIDIKRDLPTENIEKGNTDSFYISIILPETVTETDKVERTITEAFQEYSKQLSDNVAKHSIRFIKANTMTILDTYLLQQQNDWTARISDFNNRIINSKNLLQGKQVTAYGLIHDYENVDSNSDAPPVWQVMSGVTVPHVEAKNALLGLVLGFFLYVFIYLAYIILKGTSYSPRTLKDVIGDGTVCTVSLTDKKRGLGGLFHSELANKLRNRSGGSAKEDLQKTVSEIAAECKFRDLESLLLLESCSLDEEASLKMRDIIEALKGKDVTCKEKSAASLNTSDYIEMKAAAIVVQDSRSRMKDINSILEKMNSYKVMNIGIIYFE